MTQKNDLEIETWEMNFISKAAMVVAAFGFAAQHQMITSVSISKSVVCEFW